MQKLSMLTELYVAALEESKSFGVTSNDYLETVKYKENLSRILLDNISPYAQDLLLTYIDVCDVVCKHQLVDSINKGFRAGIVHANEEFKSNKRAFVSTNEILEVIAILRKDEANASDYAVLSVLSAIEDWINSGGNVKN